MRYRNWFGKIYEKKKLYVPDSVFIRRECVCIYVCECVCVCGRDVNIIWMLQQYTVPIYMVPYSIGTINRTMLYVCTWYIWTIFCCCVYVSSSLFHACTMYVCVCVCVYVCVCLFPLCEMHTCVCVNGFFVWKYIIS